jgi:hypothetical protein
MAIYKTAKGKEVDMGKLMGQNELLPAVGNAKVNARGDKLGPNGKIVQRREERYVDTGVPNQFNVRETTPAPAVATTVTAAPTKKDVTKMDPEGKE